MADHKRRVRQGRDGDTIRQSEISRHGVSELGAWRGAFLEKAYSPIEESQLLCGRYERMHGVCTPTTQERGYVLDNNAVLEPSREKVFRMCESRQPLTRRGLDGMSAAEKLALQRQAVTHGIPHAIAELETARRQAELDSACAHEASVRFASMSQDERSHLRRLSHVEQVHKNARELSGSAPFPHLRNAMVLSTEGFPRYLGHNTGM